MFPRLTLAGNDSDLSTIPIEKNQIIFPYSFSYPTTTEIWAEEQNQIYDVTFRVYIPKLLFDIRDNIYCDMDSGYGPEKLIMWTNFEKSHHVVQVCLDLCEVEKSRNYDKLSRIGEKLFFTQDNLSRIRGRII